MLPTDAIELNWTDSARSRDVPVKIYFPKEGAGPFPVIIFSHGLGGSREGYEYLGRWWSANGYICIHLQHIGSDTSVLTGSNRPMQAMRAAAMNPKNAMDRVADVKFAIDQLTSLNDSDPHLKGRLDLKNIGLAGHSFGANTTLLCGGQSLGLTGKTVVDPRIKAIIPISAPAPAIRTDLDKTYASITIPVLNITGTKDDSPIAESKAVDRRIPFDHISRAPDYLITFDGATHMVFSGRTSILPTSRESSDRDNRIREMTCQCSTAFWDANLKGDATAEKWLDDGGMKTFLSDAAVLEMKKPQ
jgi:predicted dienelactone hydrolase